MHAADPFERLPSAAAPIFRLPYEVLEEIVDISSPASQILLCRVSKLFRSLTIRSLYRDISLTSPADTVGCCRTLAGSLEAATCVKSLSISYSLPVTRNFLSSFYGLISKALRSLTNLQSLKLLVLDPSLVFALRYCTHPFLHLFECYLGLTTPLIAFLNRHPRIFYLQISPHYNEHQALSVPLWTQSTKAPLPLLPPVVHLPRLEYFVGNSHSLPIITSYAALRAAFVFWDDSAVPSFTPSTPSMNAPDPLSEAILPLEMTSTQTLNLLSCRRKGWNLDLLDIVSERLPFIYALSITNLLHDAGDGDVEGSYPSQVMLERIKQSLGRFHNLQSFHLNCVGGDGNWQPNVAVNEVDTAALEARMDRDFKTVTLWGEACPSLTELILPYSNEMKWIRPLDNAWLPDPSSPLGASWLWKMLHAKRYPSWPRILNVMEEQMRGNDGMVVRDGYLVEGAIAGMRALSLRNAWVEGGSHVDGDASDDGGLLWPDEDPAG